MQKKLFFIFLLVITFVGIGMFWFGVRWESGRVAQKLAQEQKRVELAKQVEQQARQEQSQKNIMGEIADNDGLTMTVKLNDGSEKKVVATEQTQIRTNELLKFSDLKSGQRVVVIGGQNDDKGNLQAQTIIIKSVKK